MLGIAYAASIGSPATIIGTPPNTLLVGYLEENFDISISFGEWMLFGLPVAVVFLVLAWLVLARLAFPPTLRSLPGGRELIRKQFDELGPMSRGEVSALAVFALAALSWIIIPTLADVDAIARAAPWLDNISDAGIAMAAAMVLFLLPAGGRADQQHRHSGCVPADPRWRGSGSRARADGAGRARRDGRDLRLHAPGRDAAERHRVRLRACDHRPDGARRGVAQRDRARADHRRRRHTRCLGTRPGLLTPAHVRAVG
jgi:hypothetical protein